MKTVKISEAKRHLSRLVDEAANGEPFVITKAGKPLVKVIALHSAANKQKRRVGFMAGRLVVPDDFDRMFEKEIEHLFHNIEE
jgi:prevent-host-death family protein